MWQIIINDTFRFFIKADNVISTEKSPDRMSSLTVYVGKERFYIPLSSRERAAIIPPAEHLGLTDAHAPAFVEQAEPVW